MTDEELREDTMRRSLRALRLEIPKEIADDVERNVLGYAEELRAEVARLRDEGMAARKLNIEYHDDTQKMLAKLRKERDEARDIATRLQKKGYPPWANAGGVQECPHGVAVFLACRACDAATVDSWDAEAKP